MKALKLKIKTIDIPNHYSFIGISFGWASKPCNGEVTLVTSFSNCREVLIGHFLGKARNNYKKTDLKYHIDTLKPRIIVSANNYKDHTERINNSLKILHILEKNAKWTLSKVYQLKCNDFNSNVNMTLIVGNRQWLRSPHMLSLFLLLIRIGYSFTNHGKIRSIKSLVAYFKEIEENFIGEDVDYAQDISKFIKLTKKFKTIFKDLPQRRNWSYRVLGSEDFCHDDGITAILDKHDSCYDKTLKNRIQKIVVENG